MKDFLDVLSLFLVAGGLFYSGRQLQLSVRVRQDNLKIHKANLKIHEDNHKWNRKYAAQQALMDLSTKVSGLDNLYTAFKLKELGIEKISLELINEEFKADESLRNTCHELLNYHEGLVNGINKAIYDEDVIKSYRKSAMCKVYCWFQHYIEDMQKVQITVWKEQEAQIHIWKGEDAESSKDKLIGKKTNA